MSRSKFRGKFRVFISSSLSTEDQRTLNQAVANALEPHADVYLPQRDGGLFADLLASGASWSMAASTIYNRDMGALQSSSLLLAILGRELIGAGTAFEIGAARALDIPCWAYSPAGVTRPLSPIVEVALSIHSSSLDDLALRLRAFIAR